jgi:flagellum-specific ATP synthase
MTLSPSLLDQIRAVARTQAQPELRGRVLRVTGGLFEATVSDAAVGELVEAELEPGRLLFGEVVGFRDRVALIAPLDELRGLKAGAPVRRSPAGMTVPVSSQLLGRVVDVFGRPMDGGPAIDLSTARLVPIDGSAPALVQRAAVRERLETGIRVIDGLLPFGRGQRVGLFAGAGVGKTVLVRQIAENAQADVVVMGLIGERGVEVHDLLETKTLGRTVIVAATSDRSPLERARGALTATAMAEHFALEGRHVLLVLDSVTRYAMALREIGLGAGEPPATKGYPPSVFARMPRLLERVAPFASGGSITGVYTVLVEGDDLSDPVADSVRSLLDGHVVLSRHLAARGHFPAVDVLASTSRVATKVTAKPEQALASATRRVLAVRKEAEDLRSLGAYVPGQNPAFDDALERGRKLDAWAQQGDERVPVQTTLSLLRQLVEVKP